LDEGAAWSHQLKFALLWIVEHWPTKEQEYCCGHQDRGQRHRLEFTNGEVHVYSARRPSQRAGRLLKQAAQTGSQSDAMVHGGYALGCLLAAWLYAYFIIWSGDDSNDPAKDDRFLMAWW
jgi:hypothetical protein